MSYKEMAEMVTKVWINSDGIMRLLNCGKNSAIKIRESIEKEIIDSGKLIAPSMTKYVPTKLVLERVGLDANYILEMASRT